MSDFPNKQDVTFRGWALLTTLVTFILIIVGSATRVTDSGMSCPDWPMCYGMLIPFPAPEGGYVSQGMTYHWWQVAFEWGHRLLAKVAGLMILTAFIWALVLRKRNPRLWKVAGVALLFLVSQVLVGGLTIKMSNLHWTVALHLGNAVFVLSLLVWLFMASSRSPSSSGIEVNPPIKWAFFVMLTLVFVTMIMGAMVSSAHAGGSCGGLFSCQGSWLPQGDFQQFLHMKHRYLALTTFAWSIVLMVLAKREDPQVRKSARFVHVFVLIQVVFGVSVLYSFSNYADFYQTLSVTHLAWGMLVYSMTLIGIGKIYMGPKEISTKGVPWH
jgi:cytochrome c oxidase assembly protein subunit 15